MDNTEFIPICQITQKNNRYQSFGSGCAYLYRRVWSEIGTGSPISTKRLVQTPHATRAQRLTDMFARALGRRPSHEELNRWSAAVADLAAAHAVGPETAMQCVPVWKDIAHALFNTKEFIYLR
jgi:hypothetical protein